MSDQQQYEENTGLAFKKQLEDELDSRDPIFRLFPYNGTHDPMFDMWWHKLPLWEKIKYKIRLWLW